MGDFKLYDHLKIDFRFDDDRGSLIQLISHGFEQINVLISKKGAFRGEHGHRERKEAFYIISGRVITYFSGQGKIMEMGFGEGDFFVIYPKVVHSMSFLEDTVMVAMYDKCVVNPDGSKDIFTPEEL